MRRQVQGHDRRSDESRQSSSCGRRRRHLERGNDRVTGYLRAEYCPLRVQQLVIVADDDCVEMENHLERRCDALEH
jgi:hypothetical protein